MHKYAQELELPKLTFQVIRRTIATLARKKGDVKDVQGVMRHTRTATMTDVQGVMRHTRTATMTDVYMQELPEGVRATVNSIHQELTRNGSGTGDGGPGPRKPPANRGKILTFSSRKAVASNALGDGKVGAVFSGR